MIDEWLNTAWRWGFVGYCFVAFKCGFIDHVCSVVDKHISSMGPTIIKAAQLLAQRPDVIPHKLQKTLEKVYDNVDPDESIEERVRQFVAEKGLGEDGSLRLIGSGSLSQVYAYQDTYAIKCLRMNIIENVMRDFQLIRAFVNTYFKFSFYHSDIMCIVKYLEDTIYKQCNFGREVGSMDLFSPYTTSYVRAPKVYHELSTQDMIVMEYCGGGTPLHMCTEEQLAAMVKKHPQLCLDLCDFVIRPLVEKHVYNGDLHPGNILVFDDHLTIIDYGWVSEIPMDVFNVLLEIVPLHKNKQYREAIAVASQYAFESTLKPTEKQQEEIAAIVEATDDDVTLVKMTEALTQYCVENRLQIKSSYLQILIARLNGFLLFKYLQQDFSLVMDKFDEVLNEMKGKSVKIVEDAVVGALEFLMQLSQEVSESTTTDSGSGSNSDSDSSDGVEL